MRGRERPGATLLKAWGWLPWARCPLWGARPPSPLELHFGSSCVRTARGWGNRVAKAPQCCPGLPVPGARLASPHTHQRRRTVTLVHLHPGRKTTAALGSRSPWTSLCVIPTLLDCEDLYEKTFNPLIMRATGRKPFLLSDWHRWKWWLKAEPAVVADVRRGRSHPILFVRQ